MGQDSYIATERHVHADRGHPHANMHRCTKTKRKQSIKARKTCTGRHARHVTCIHLLNQTRAEQKHARHAWGGTGCMQARACPCRPSGDQDPGEVSAHTCKSSARLPVISRSQQSLPYGGVERCRRHDVERLTPDTTMTHVARTRRPLMSPNSARCRSRGHRERRPPQRAT